VAACSLGEAPPAASTVVGDDATEKGKDRWRIDVIVAVDLDRSGRGVAVSLVDHALGVGNGRIVDEDVHMILRTEQGADVAVEHEVRLDGALDRLFDGRVCLVHEVADFLTDRLLPLR